MRDSYSTEYTELRNAPHFIFNGKHTRDFYVSNVQVDSGLAKDTFLATRDPIIERTRYSEKSYLLGINEEPIRFKIRLLFEEHQLKTPNLQGLKRWLKTDTFKEFRFDSENESNPTILMYAMVINSSEVSHNVINDGYVDLEFETSSSVKYSEIMEDEVDLTKSAADKIAYNFKRQFNSLTTTHKNLASKLKQYVTRTNYAGLNKYFQDVDNNEIPDGWTITGGLQSGLSIDGTRLSINNVKLRKNLNLINGRNYYLNVEGLNGKVGIHGSSLDINTMDTHVFKYRRNLLGSKGDFSKDTNDDGVSDGWNKTTGTYNLSNKTQNVTTGVISTSITIIPKNKYLLKVESPNSKVSIKIGNKTFSSNSSTTFYTTFVGEVDTNTIVLQNGSYKNLGVYILSDKEFNEFSKFTKEYVEKEYLHFSYPNYLELDFTGDEGYVDYFNLYELSDLDKSRIDSGTHFDDIIGVNYQEYIKMLNGYKTRIQPLVNELTAYGEELNHDPSGVFAGIYREILELSKRIEGLLIKLNREDDDSLFEWEDIQPDYNEIMNILRTFDDLANRTAQLLVANKTTIENSDTFNQDVVEIYNQGDAEIYPTFYLKSLDGSDITITNLDTNESTTITNNIVGEEITMIGESERILTSRSAPYYKYDSHDDVFIRLQVGHNALKFTGNLTVKMIYQFKYL